MLTKWPQSISRTKQGCKYGSVIQGFAKVPLRFVLAYLAVKNTIVAPQWIYYPLPQITPGDTLAMTAVVDKVSTSFGS